MLTNAPKGTKDMLPQDAYKWKYVRNAFADICAKYGFKQIATPVFEHTELFKRGVGDTTDIVQKGNFSCSKIICRAQGLCGPAAYKIFL